MTRVSSFQTWQVRIPYEEGRRFGNHIIVRLRTDDGLEGIGYVSNLSPALIKAQKVAIETFAEFVIGEDPMAVERVNASLMGRAGIRDQFWGMARSAISVLDIALWDLKAKIVRQPLHRLLGAQGDEVDVYASWNLWWQYDLPTLARHAQEHLDRGFRAMKYRLGGVTSTREAVERTRVLRETVGPDVDLLVDMNWSWTVNETIERGRALQEFGLYWIEDPIPAQDIEGLREIALALETPIAAGETYDSLAQFRTALERRAVDKVIVDLEVGGITPFLKVAHIVESFGKGVASHTCTEVGAPVIAALTNGLTVEYLPWAQPVFREVPAVKDGKLVLSDRSGLGLQLDEAALQTYAAS